MKIIKIVEVLVIQKYSFQEISGAVLGTEKLAWY